MKIPVWLASTLLAGAFCLAAVAFTIEHEENKTMRDDITQLKVDVAWIKGKMDPAMRARADVTNSRLALTVP